MPAQITDHCASPGFEDGAGRLIRSNFDVFGQYEILSVDDDPVNQMVVEGMLRPAAYKARIPASVPVTESNLEAYLSLLPSLFRPLSPLTFCFWQTHAGACWLFNGYRPRVTSSMPINCFHMPPEGGASTVNP